MPTFSEQEANEIKRILRQLRATDNPNEQRQFRNTLRRDYGFYISHFGTFRPDGMTAEDFDDLAKRGVITIHE